MAERRGRRKKNKVGKVLEEFKEGTLRSSSGKKVTSRRQALAIGLSEERRRRRGGRRSR